MNKSNKKNQCLCHKYNLLKNNTLINYQLIYCWILRQYAFKYTTQKLIIVYKQKIRR